MDMGQSVKGSPMALTGQQLIEIDRCFQFVCERIQQDGVHPRKVLFGSTVANWMKGRMEIVAATNAKGYDVPTFQLPIEVESEKNQDWKGD